MVAKTTHKKYTYSKFQLCFGRYRLPVSPHHAAHARAAWIIDNLKFQPVTIISCPPDKIDADLAKALMSIGTVKGVETGAGFQAARMTGSECNDPITPQGFATNHAGGVLAGITTGDEIIIKVACKPISSIEKTQDTINVHGKPTTVSIHGRHDVSVIPRIIPVCEAMVSIILADHLVRQRALVSAGGS